MVHFISVWVFKRPQINLNLGLERKYTKKVLKNAKTLGFSPLSISDFPQDFAVIWGSSGMLSLKKNILDMYMTDYNTQNR